MIARTCLLLLAVVTVGCNRTASKPAVAVPTNGPEPTPSISPRAPAVEPAAERPERWESLRDAVDPARDGVAGSWSKSDGLRVAAAMGARIAMPAAPPAEFDFRVSFTRQTGVHSIAIFFPHGAGRAAFEVDAWGEHLAGFQNVGGRSIRENPTRRPNVQLENGRRYTMTLEVRTGQVRGFLDDQLIATLATDGRDLALSDLWSMPNAKALGLGAWNCDTVFHSVELRRVSETAARTSPPPPVSTPVIPAPATPPATTAKAASAKRVLIVVANHHFFYREYGDPRAELEKAGIRVTVAAGTKGVCRPHSGSGEGRDGGAVQADLALADVKADDYDAILFSGGWGSSAYQFAFPGRYDDATYNGTAAVKREANRVIGDFVKQDKYVCALCNGVTVLAWARVDGKSPLQGKRVCAPTRQAAPGIYNGQRAQPSCRWHPQQNGAQLVPAGSIGRPNTAEDDVVVDGKIVTGEDDISAREMGRRIVQLLAQ